MSLRVRSRSLAISGWVYRSLLMLYPTKFRDEYGEAMVQVFRDCHRDTYRQHGTLGVTRFWLATIGDLVSSAFAERISEVLNVSASRPMIRSLVVSVIIGAVLGLLSHFLDDLLGAIPAVGPSIVSSDYFVLLVIAFWSILAVAVVWENVGLQGRPWRAGTICAVLWTSAFVTFFLYDLYRLWPRIVDGTVDPRGLGWIVFFALSLFGGFGIGWVVSNLRSRFTGAIA